MMQRMNKRNIFLTKTAQILKSERFFCQVICLKLITFDLHASDTVEIYF